MAGFLTDPNNNEFPIPFYNKNIEPLLFPSYGKGFYIIMMHKIPLFKRFIKKWELKDKIAAATNYYNIIIVLTSLYLLITLKLRNHQNRTKILNQHSTFLLYQLTAADFITNNIYTECPIINETKTTTVASYISTGVSYFCQKEHHINTMVQGFGLPQISYTMTIAEIYWLLIGDLAQLQHVNEQQVFYTPE
ncbi:hypothetical protein RhiirC2_784275 [Rhizophagus irregularis]|uniref:Uncharacterized protein n=1 Tax=Rhizophagus irregularis TaxID=588596 RepID=A0A2N1MYX7_9GLOM|nr:hypothetical protein RhiirC2_784275 [Rhizophagus irregularis]